MNSLRNQTVDAAIQQLFNNLSPDEPGCTYIASFDDSIIRG